MAGTIDHATRSGSVVVCPAGFEGYSGWSNRMVPRWQGVSIYPPGVRRGGGWLRLYQYSQPAVVLLTAPSLAGTPDTPRSARPSAWGAPCRDAAVEVGDVAVHYDWRKAPTSPTST